MDTLIERRMLYKYPWLPGAQDIFESEKDFKDFMSSEPSQDTSLYFETLLGAYFQKYPKLKHLLIQTFIFALEKREEGVIISDKDDFSIIYFYIVKTILAAINKKMLDNHIANFLSSIYQQKMMNENNATLTKLANFMNLSCQFSSKNVKTIDDMKFPYTVDFTSYVNTANLMKSNSYNLVNRGMEMGKVYLLKDELVRLMKERIRIEIIPVRTGPVEELLEKIKLVPEILEILTSINNKLDLIKIQENRFKASSNFEDYTVDEKIPYDLYPPCIKFILNKALDGVNLTHNERLHIAFFFANTNHSVEETIDVFRTVPDFNEEIARYNVEFSRGIGGKGKKYKTFNCAKLKSFQMCKGQEKEDLEYRDEICYKGVKKRDEKSFSLIKSPLNFVFWKRVHLFRQKKNDEKLNDQKFGAANESE